MSDVLKAAVLGDELDLTALAHNAAGQAEHVVRKVFLKSLDEKFAFDIRKMCMLHLSSYKLAGTAVTSVPFPIGSRTTIFWRRGTAPRSPASGRASSPSSGYTRKRGIYGHIY